MGEASLGWRYLDCLAAAEVHNFIGCKTLVAALEPYPLHQSHHRIFSAACA